MFLAEILVKLVHYITAKWLSFSKYTTIQIQMLPPIVKRSIKSAHQQSSRQLKYVPTTPIDDRLEQGLPKCALWRPGAP